MKRNVKGFSIVELLTVMSIIVLLLSLLLPGMNMVRRYAKDLTQRAQFYDIAVGLDLFFSDEKNALEKENYVDSSRNDTNGSRYCGAMKLCEAMKGQDGLGLHQDSRLNEDGLSASGEELYPDWGDGLPTYTPEEISNLRARVKYIDKDKINVTSLSQIYSDVTPFTAVDPNEGGGCAVITDVYKKYRNIETMEKVGLPILYYRADGDKLSHNIDDPNDSQNIYDYMDNQDLLDLGLPDDKDFVHPLFQDDADPTYKDEGQLFYRVTRNEKAPSIHQPYNKDTYILIAAGHDGIYGTRDDIYNFDK